MKGAGASVDHSSSVLSLLCHYFFHTSLLLMFLCEVDLICLSLIIFSLSLLSLSPFEFLSYYFFNYAFNSFLSHSSLPDLLLKITLFFDPNIVSFSLFIFSLTSIFSTTLFYLCFFVEVYLIFCRSSSLPFP